MRDVWRIGAGCGLCGWSGKNVDGVFPGRPESFRRQRRPVGDSSPGRGWMAQNGGTRGGTFHREMHRSKKARTGLQHAVICPIVTGRTKVNLAQSGLVLVRSPLLTSHKWRELVSSGRLVCRYHEVFLWCYLCLVYLCFRLYAFVEATAFRSIVLQCAGASIATRVSVFFIFFYLEIHMSPFPSIFCTIIAVFSLYGEYVVRSFLSNGVFLPCDHGLDFLHQLM